LIGKTAERETVSRAERTPGEGVKKATEMGRGGGRALGDGGERAEWQHVRRAGVAVPCEV
jgi:hypothetical protein